MTATTPTLPNAEVKCSTTVLNCGSTINVAWQLIARPGLAINRKLAVPIDSQLSMTDHKAALS